MNFSHLFLMLFYSVLWYTMYIVKNKKSPTNGRKVNPMNEITITTRSQTYLLQTHKDELTPAFAEALVNSVGAISGYVWGLGKKYRVTAKTVRLLKPDYRDLEIAEQIAKQEEENKEKNNPFSHLD